MRQFSGARSAIAMFFVLLCSNTLALAQVFTGPYGPGNTWNLYEVVTVPATWLEANTQAISREASTTGLSEHDGHD